MTFKKLRPLRITCGSHMLGTLTLIRCNLVMEDHWVREPNVLLERAVVQVGLFAAGHNALILQACLLQIFCLNSADNKTTSCTRRSTYLILVDLSVLLEIRAGRESLGAVLAHVGAIPSVQP